MNPIKSLAERILRPELRAVEAVTKNRLWLMEASLADLQRELRGWKLLSAGDSAQFSREDIGAAIEQSRAACLRNSYAIRWLNVMTYYTFGQGYAVTSESLQDSIKRFIEDRHNANQLFGHDGTEYANRELCATGNLFVLRIPSGTPQVRVLPVEQFREVVCNPDDAEERWFYLRERTEYKAFASDGGTPKKYYHPDGGLDEQRLRQLKAEYGEVQNGIPIVWDKPVAHYKIGGYHHWKWGLPPAYAAITWMRAHTRFISEWTTVVSALSRFANQVIGQGATPEQISAAQQVFQSALVGSTTEDETNPPHTTGSTWVSNDQWQVKPFQARGMAIDPSDGKEISLMVFAVLGLPAHFFGDVDQGNLATATSLDRPTELLFRHHQEYWAQIFKAECDWGVGQMKRTGMAGTRAGESDISVDFPPILHHDPQSIMQALVTGLTLNGQPLSPMFQGSEKELTREIMATADIDKGTIERVLDAVYDDAGNFKNPPAQPVAPTVPTEGLRPERALLVRKVEALTRTVLEAKAA